MRRLDRYILRMFLARLLVVGVALLAIYLGVDLIEKLRWVTRANVPLLAFFHFFLLRLPLALAQVLPLASLFAGALTVSSLNRRQELTAMRCAGIAPGRALAPLLLGGLMAGLLQLTVSETWLPRAQRELETLQAGELAPALRREAFAHDRWYLQGALRIRIGLRVAPSELQDVEILLISPSGALSRHLLAPVARWDGRQWLAPTAESWSFDADKNAHYEALSQSTLPLVLGPAALEATAPVPDQLSLSGLQEAIRVGRETGREVHVLVRTLGLRLLLPLSCLLLVLLGVPGCARPGAASSTAGALARALGIGVLYLLTTGVSLFLVEAGSMLLWLEILAVQLLWLLFGAAALFRIP